MREVQILPRFPVAFARRLFVGLLTLLAVAAGCTPEGTREVVVTRDQLGTAWTLQVNSATVVCSEAEGAVLKVGTKRYALNDKARERGLPDAREVSRIVLIHSGRPEGGTAFADTDVLGALCRS